MGSDRLNNLMRSALNYLSLGIVGFLSVFPFFWMVIGATNSSADIIRGKASFGDALWVNVAAFFTQVDAPLVFWNSLKIAILSCVLTLGVSSLAGYGFEMFRSRARQRLYNALLLTLFIPFAALMIPLFIMMSPALPIIMNSGIISAANGMNRVNNKAL